nr:hypothetical protein [Tanacetum cinerariifolium]GEW61221.1 hypothetical protein [Tanacetum cinerariifolium]
MSEYVCVKYGQRIVPCGGVRECETWLTWFICGLSSSDCITDIKYVLTQKALTFFCEMYHIPDEVHPQLPSPNQTIHEMPSGKIGVYTSKGVPKDPFPKSFEFSAKHFATLVTHPALFHKYPESFLCLVGISRYYTLDEDTYLEFLEMDLLSFIWTADPTQVRVAERQRVEDEPRLLESTVGRVVPLLPIAHARASSELEASVDKFFDDGTSGDGQGAKIRKIDAADASGPSHPPKKLREDFGALGGASTTGKSRSAVQKLFTGAIINVEARGEPIPTFPFVTSSVSATPEREDKSPADSVTGLNLRTIGAPQRFVISSDSSHHSGANITEAEVDSIVRVPVEPSLFGVGSSSTGRTDSVPGGFSDVSGSDFLIGGIRTVVDPDSDLKKVYVPQWSTTNGFGLNDSRICREMLDEIAPLKCFTSVRGMDHDQLFTEFNVRAARQISLSAEVRMRAEYNIREKKRLRTVFDEQAELLKREKNELSLKVTDLSASVKVREQDVADLDAQVTAIKLQNDNLVDQKFYSHLLTTISGRRWLLTHGMKLAVVRCLNSTEYLSALGAAISKAVEKGMQEGLSARINHGAEGRKLADVAAYNPPAEADYLSALQRLQNVNFSLIVELKSNKDASVNTILNLLCLDDALAERLGTEGTSDSAHDTTTTLFVTFVFAGTIPPISTDDYEVAHADGQGVPVWMMKPQLLRTLIFFLMLATQS